MGICTRKIGVFSRSRLCKGSPDLFEPAENIQKKENDRVGLEASFLVVAIVHCVEHQVGGNSVRIEGLFKKHQNLNVDSPMVLIDALVGPQLRCAVLKLRPLQCFLHWLLKQCFVLGNWLSFVDAQGLFSLIFFLFMVAIRQWLNESCS
jgi:hypothetical protein